MKRGYFDKDASALVSQMLGEMRYTVLISMKSINQKKKFSFVVLALGGGGRRGKKRHLRYENPNFSSSFLV